MALDKPDLCIIGSGPGGIALAREARDRGAGVIMVAHDTPRNDGNLAAHALAETARLAHRIRNARMLAISTDAPRINFARVNARIQEVVGQGRIKDSPEQLAAIGVEVIAGPARFVDARTLQAGPRTIRARKFVLDTGGRPAIPDIPGLADTPHYTTDTIFDVSRRPTHLIVLGAGSTGLMLAQSHLRLGCAVTLIDTHAPLADADPELADIALARLADEGLEILRDTGVVRVAGEEGAITLDIKTGAHETALSGSHLLVTAGRAPDIAGLGLDKARVAIEGGRIALSPGLRTSNRRIYCLGDLVGGHGSVQAARRHAAIVAERTLGLGRPTLAPEQVVQVVHTDPPIAWVGVGVGPEAARKRFGANHSLVRHPISELDAARAKGDETGLVRVIVQRSGRVLGAGAVGHGAGEVIALFALAMGRGLTLEQMAAVIPPHPGYAEIVSGLARTWRLDHPPGPGRERILALRRLLP